jgi:hypothetical protein
LQSEQVKEKRRCTNLKKYGVPIASQKHIKNYSDYNAEYIVENFMQNGRLNLHGAINYFNITPRSLYLLLHDANIQFKSITQAQIEIANYFPDVFEMESRTIIKPYELDLYSKEHNLAIEYNGIYWHSDLFKDKNYHLNKTLRCEEKGIQLFHIFEHEWQDEQKKNIWLSMISNKLNLNKVKIPARKCQVTELTTKETRDFLQNNHLQGYTNSKVKLGLIYEGELVSVMTFGKPRYNKKYEWELIRFASKLNTNVLGSASKLFSYFNKTYNPRSMISYADKRYSMGELYSTLGFECVKDSQPNYYYIDLNKGIVYNRLQFQKHKLQGKLEYFNKKLSEYENMINHGFVKIYDCGTSIWRI